jgi:hypothetical protein
MKITDVLVEKTQAPRPRNFVAKNAAKTTSGAGKHKDKKKAAKQGDVKHKGRVAEGTENMSIGQQMARDGITYSPEKEGELIKLMGEYMEKAGMSPKAIRYYLSHDEDFVSDQLEYLPRKDVAETDDWGSMGHSEFKRKELQHELGHEDDPEFQRQMREKDRGPWYIKIDGKIYRQKGEPKVFDWKKAANNYALAMLKNKPELKAKTMLTRKPVDEMRETATAGSTSAGNIAVGAVYKNKKGRTYKNPDGTAKNALDVKGANLLTGGSIAKR